MEHGKANYTKNVTLTSMKETQFENIRNLNYHGGQIQAKIFLNHTKFIQSIYHFVLNSNVDLKILEQ
jgi:hypothetical protein